MLQLYLTYVFRIEFNWRQEFGSSSSERFFYKMELTKEKQDRRLRSNYRQNYYPSQMSNKHQENQTILNKWNHFSKMKKNNKNIPMAINERSICIFFSKISKSGLNRLFCKYGLSPFLTLSILFCIIETISLYMITNLKRK